MTGKATELATTQDGKGAVTVFRADELPQLIAGIPDAEGDAESRIIEALLNAQNIGDLNAPWQSGSLGKYKDTVLTVTDVSKLPSDKDQAMGYFLVLRGTVRGTGEPFVASTSSHAIMAALTRLWLAHAIPVDVIPRKADKPTRNGFYPEHLEIVSA